MKTRLIPIVAFAIIGTVNSTRALEFAASGTCVEDGTGTEAGWDARLNVSGTVLEGIVNLGGQLGSASVLMAGVTDGREVRLSFTDPSGVQGTFTGNILGSVVRGVYVVGLRAGTWRGEWRPIATAVTAKPEASTALQ